ncbi:MAG: hypothetical protein A2020_08490 [Lentisphaerae bacterium GWF2_45_14]|nr:MAG: hypothetical protein A2020_08490 [Lentisphaerae bacterium GWF2_45_14]
MKFYLVILITALAFSVSYADDKKDVQSSGEYEKLVEGKKKNESKMYELRLKLIKEDPELEALHRKIMALHKELALRLDKKDEMKKLLEKQKELSSEIEKMLRKRKTENVSN